jgi:hypothetical protein
MHRAIALLLCLASTSFGQAPEPTDSPPPAADVPIDFAKVIAEVEATAKKPPANAAIIAKFEKLREEFELRKVEIARAARARYESAANSEASAIQFFTECTALAASSSRGGAFTAPTPPPTQDTSKSKQDDRRSSGSTRGKDSKKGNTREEQPNDAAEIPGRGAFLQLQLQYLVFTMEAVDMKDRGLIVGRLREFSTRAAGLVRHYASVAPVDPSRSVPVGSSSDKREAAEQRAEQAAQRARQSALTLANQGVMGSVFTSAYNLTTFFKPLPNWPSSPLNLETVYSGQVLPYYRETKPDSLGNGWDEYMALKAALKRIETDEITYTYWAATELRNIQWEKWKDMLFSGVSQTLAADELAKLAHDNVNFSNISHWTSEVEKIKDALIKGETPANLGPGKPAPEPPPQTQTPLSRE